MKKETQLKSGQNLTGGLEFFNLKTGAVSLVPTAAANSPQFFQQAEVLEKVVALISQRTRPVIVGTLKDEGFSFATEKTHALGDKVAEVQDAIQAMGTVQFGASTVDLSAVELELVTEFVLDGLVPATP